MPRTDLPSSHINGPPIRAPDTGKRTPELSQAAWALLRKNIFDKRPVTASGIPPVVETEPSMSRKQERPDRLGKTKGNNGNPSRRSWCAPPSERRSLAGNRSSWKKSACQDRDIAQGIDQENTRPSPQVREFRIPATRRGQFNFDPLTMDELKSDRVRPGPPCCRSWWITKRMPKPSGQRRSRCPEKKLRAQHAARNRDHVALRNQERHDRRLGTNGTGSCVIIKKMMTVYARSATQRRPTGAANKK